MPKIPKPSKNETMQEFRNRLVKKHNDSAIVAIGFKKKIKQLCFTTDLYKIRCVKTSRNFENLEELINKY